MNLIELKDKIALRGYEDTLIEKIGFTDYITFRLSSKVKVWVTVKKPEVLVSIGFVSGDGRNSGRVQIAGKIGSIDLQFQAYTDEANLKKRWREKEGIDKFLKDFVKVIGPNSLQFFEEMRS